ncbi:MAG: LytR/AlgR family response regulator transcription factor [Crocinitomicaceae bacterium]
MIKALIVEDERYIREGLKAQLKDLTEDIEITGECESVQQAIAHCNKVMPDLVFLDINLKDGSGFDFLNELEDAPFKVIFITAYEEYVLKALKLGAIDYILKPISQEELNEALQKVMAFGKTQTEDRLAVVKDQFAGKNNRMVLRMHESYQMIDFTDLMYCEADGGYTKFFLQDKRTFMVSKTLKDFANQLPTDIFVRTHQSYLVNTTFIDSYDKTRFLYLKNGDKIPVSMRKRESVISKIFGEL